MTEKIEWYKEVLELEPNSKVFFPLARLLSEAGRTDEAVEILEQGLARHEEFLEARLFLIELLHTANRLEACEKQVGRLTKMFSTYAGFWQAWAACINAAGDAPDTAAVLRFLALNFSKGRYHCTKSSTKGWPPCLELEPLLALRPVRRRVPRPLALLLARPYMRRHLQQLQRLHARR